MERMWNSSPYIRGSQTAQTLAQYSTSRQRGRQLNMQGTIWVARPRQTWVMYTKPKVSETLTSWLRSWADDRLDECGRGQPLPRHLLYQTPGQRNERRRGDSLSPPLEAEVLAESDHPSRLRNQPSLLRALGRTSCWSSRQPLAKGPQHVVLQTPGGGRGDFHRMFLYLCPEQLYFLIFRQAETCTVGYC